jgi:hypothetical protein
MSAACCRMGRWPVSMLRLLLSSTSCHSCL